MTQETVQALERIQAQLANLRKAESLFRALQAQTSAYSKDEVSFILARFERAANMITSQYNLLLVEHRLAAKCAAQQETQLPLF